MTTTILLSAAVLLFVLLVIQKLLNTLIQKAFYHPHVTNCDSPKDFNFEYQEYFLPTAGGKKIQTYLIGADNPRPFIVMIHGWANCSEKFFPMAENLAARGWRLALVNARNHSGSDPDDYSTMVKFSEDLNAALSFIQREFGKEQKIGLLGHSLGGATSLYVAANDSRIGAVSAIGSFSDLEKMLRDSFHAHHVPNLLITPLVYYIEKRIGAKLSDLAPVSNVGKLKKPLGLVHGKKDTVVSFDNFEELKAAAGRKYLHTFEDDQADHSSLLGNPHVFDFIDSFFAKSLS